MSLLLLISPTGSFLSKIAPSSSATKVEGLPLNTQSKGIVDQACLINYAGCDENLKCAGYRPYGATFVFFAGTTSNGFISSSSHPIHKLFKIKEEDDFISNEMRSLSGVLWKLNPSDRTIALTKLLIKHAKLQTKETEIGA